MTDLHGRIVMTNLYGRIVMTDLHGDPHDESLWMNLPGRIRWTVMSSGDGWSTCALGHRHWGRYGAAGLLIIESGRAILQHRAPWTHEGDTWGVVGGARDAEESALEAALREAAEEAGILPVSIAPIGMFIDDHVGWTYSTIVARPVGQIAPMAANSESVSVQWHQLSDIATLRLHTGLAGSWGHLRNIPQPLYLVVPDELQSSPRLIELARHGIEVAYLPSGMTGGGLSRLFPRVVPVELARHSGGGSAAAVAAVSVQYSELGQVLIAMSPQDLDLLSGPAR